MRNRDYAGGNGPLNREFAGWEIQEGLPGPMGVSWSESRQTYNFALYSRRATGVSLLLYNEADPVRPVYEYRLSPRMNKSGRIWHCAVTARQANGATLYAYRVDGLYEPARGYRFDP